MPLYVDRRGLTTRRLHHGRTTFQIDFDVLGHCLIVRTHDGGVRAFELADGVAVADFDTRLHEALIELRVNVAIKERPSPVSPAWWACPDGGVTYRRHSGIPPECGDPASRREQGRQDSNLQPPVLETRREPLNHAP